MVSMNDTARDLVIWIVFIVVVLDLVVTIVVNIVIIMVILIVIVADAALIYIKQTTQKGGIVDTFAIWSWESWIE